MKKQILLLLVLLALFSVPVFALAAEEPFSIDPFARTEGIERSYDVGYIPQIRGDTLSLWVPITSEQAQGSLEGRLTARENAPSPVKAVQVTARATPRDGIWHLKFNVPLYADRISGDYAFVLHLVGQDAAGDPVTGEIALTLPIRDGRDPEFSAIRLSEVTSALNVGEAGEVTLTLANPSEYTVMENLTLRLGENAVLFPQQSDTFPLESLAPGETRRVTLPLRVQADAAVGLHRLGMDFSWETLGQPRTHAETLTLPVTQEIRLEHGGVQIAPSLLQGQLAGTTLNLMNMGRGTLHNVLATLTLEGIAREQSVLVGTLAPGASGEARITFTPSTEVLGTVQGEIQVSCEDAWGNGHRFTLPLSTHIEPAPVLPEALPAEEEETAPTVLPYVLAALAALLLIALVAQGLLLGKKIRKLEEERL